MTAENHFARGLESLDRYLLNGTDEVLQMAVDAFRSSTRLAPLNPLYWTALGFTLDVAGRREAALGALQEAHALDPDDQEVEVLILTLLSESGSESAAMSGLEKVAARRNVDLRTLRHDLIEAEMPIDSQTLLQNGFPHARNFLRSRVEDQIEQSQRAANTMDERVRQRDDEEQHCAAMQNELERSFDVSRVPSAIQALKPWAVRLGVGDDPCRDRLMGRLSDRERSDLLRAVAEHASAIHGWLDEVGDRSMTLEAAAFMYLLLAVEDITVGSE